MCNMIKIFPAYAYSFCLCFCTANLCRLCCLFYQLNLKIFDITASFFELTNSNVVFRGTLVELLPEPNITLWQDRIQWFWIVLLENTDFIGCFWKCKAVTNYIFDFARHFMKTVCLSWCRTIVCFNLSLLKWTARR